MHGGPPASLIGRAVDQEARRDEHVARLNVELERPVPLARLRTTTSRRQVSRRVAHLDVVLETDDAVVASARALLVQKGPIPEPGWSAPPTEAVAALPDAETLLPAWGTGEQIAYHHDGAEHRFLSGSFDAPGPAASWVRLRQPLVEGEETCGLGCVLAAADFGSGISNIYDFSAGFGLINADLSLVLRREPAGPWIGIDSTTTVDGVGRDGTGLATTMLTDRNGPLGMATQSLMGYQT